MEHALERARLCEAKNIIFCVVFNNIPNVNKVEIKHFSFVAL